MVRFSAGVIAVSVAAFALSGCSYKRAFTEREQAVKSEWLQLQSDLRHRNDLLPPLIEAIKTDAPDEQALVQTLSESHSRLAAASTRADTFAAANEQWAALQRLQAVVDAHPPLKNDAGFNEAIKELGVTEDRIAVGRMRYGAQVQLYRMSQRSLLGMLTAVAMRGEEYPFFQVPPSVRPRGNRPVEPDFEP